MSKMGQGLDKRLEEWVGFIPIAIDGYAPFWKDPNYKNIDNAPDFTESLDACFKWLVPKYISILMESVSEQTAYEMLFYKWLQEGFDALALCLAIEKLIDGGK